SAGVKDMKVDAQGHIYLGCSFTGTIDADPGPSVSNFLQQGIGFDILLQKLDSAGGYVWGKQIGGLLQDEILSLSIDSMSNIYITGQFKSTVDFDPSPGTINLTSAGDFDAFIAKFDSAGNYSWAKRIGGPNEDVGRG